MSSCKSRLYASRAGHLSACLFHVSACGAIIAAATANSRRLSQQNPYKTCVSLVELGRTSRHFIVHFKTIPTKIILRYGRCAGNLTVGELTVTGVPLFLFAFLVSSRAMDGGSDDDTHVGVIFLTHRGQQSSIPGFPPSGLCLSDTQRRLDFAPCRHADTTADSST